MTSTLFRGGRVRLPGSGPAAEWALVDDGRVVGTGGPEDRPRADRSVDLDGGALVMGFCDAHVHLPVTGLYLEGMDFRGEKRAEVIVSAFRERAARGGTELLFGGNFEDPLDEPLDGRHLDDAVGDRPALLARADMHSCIVSTNLLRSLELDALEGVDRDEDGTPTGYLREQAAAEAWSWFDANLSPAQQRVAVTAAAQHAYSKGVTQVHEMFVVDWRGWPAAEVFMETATTLELDVLVYLGTAEVEKVAATGARQIGGDFFLDGSFGSHTAWMKEPYATDPPEGYPKTGIPYRSDEEVLDFFLAAQNRGLQVGVHAIGDAAIEQATSAWEKVAAIVGADAVRALGHRIEHFECASDESIEVAARLGLGASVQPAFDRFWGGAEGLYSLRIGWERARAMNRFGSMATAGLRVGAGSDSTVTPLDPFLQMAALRAHHVDDERMDAAAALDAHTLGGRSLAPAGSIDTRGADLALLDRDPLEVDVDELLKTEVRATWCGGAKVFPPGEAEAR